MDTSDLPHPARDLIAAAELEADSKFEEHQQAGNHYLAEARDLGADPSGIGYSPGSIPLELAREQFAEGRNEAATQLFEGVAPHYWAQLKPDVGAFSAKLDAIWEYVSQRFHPNAELRETLKRNWKMWALLERAALNLPILVTTNKPSPISQFPHRASWLKDRLHERSWNQHDPHRQGGPDHKTVQKILDGTRVREDVLDKLATALSKASDSKRLPTVTVRDIPQD